MVMVSVRFWLVEQNPNQTAIRTMTAPCEAVDNGDMGRDAPYPGAVDGSGYGAPDPPTTPTMRRTPRAGTLTLSRTMVRVRREIATTFLARDESQLVYYEEITKRMPG
jgi:hypothetical protein